MSETKKKIAIIGGGISGLSIAYYLIKKGFKPTIFDPNPYENASFCSQGVATSKGLKEARKPLFRAKLSGHVLLEKIILDIESHYPGLVLHKKGVFEPFGSNDEYLSKVQRIYRWDKPEDFGVKVINRQSRASAEKEAFEKMNVDAEGALFYPEDYFFNTPLFLESLTRYLAEKGCEFVSKVAKILQAKQKDLEKSPTYQIDGRDFDHVFLCCSVGMNELLTASGLKPIKSRLKSGITLEISSNSMDFHGIKSGLHSINFLGQLRVGSHDYVGEPSKQVFEKARDFLSGFFHKFFSAQKFELSSFSLDENPNAASRYLKGTRVNGWDRNPLVGSLNISDPLWKNVWISSGFHKSGYCLGPYFGRLLVDTLSQGSCDFTHPLIHGDLLNTHT